MLALSKSMELLHKFILLFLVFLNALYSTQHYTKIWLFVLAVELDGLSSVFSMNITAMNYIWFCLVLGISVNP
jgi:hypothetical protein